MANLEVSWQSGALRLLDKRDRYTRNAIVEEFTRDPERGAVTFDRDQHGFVTSVADGRFSVVWNRVDELGQTIAVVRAVVSLTELPSASDKPDELKQYIQRAVETESKGAIAV